MPKIYSSKQIVRILERHDFLFVSQKGSHAKYIKLAKKNLVVIIPMSRREIPMGTFRSICRQSNLSPEDFETR
ncbi:MAG: type II toxin-antitoxin system HicA family toxin [bacterium]|nr:type II toxin-antitoxin system HicA family toxin [bacterium]